MEAKEAIEFLKLYKYKHIGEPCQEEEGIDDIIDLLLQGEVYRQMIEKMKKDKYDVWVSLPGSFTNLPDFVRDVEKEVTGE